MSDIVLIFFIGLLCGADNFVEIARWANTRQDWFHDRLDIERIPSSLAHAGKGQTPVVWVSSGYRCWHGWGNTHFYGALNLSNGREVSLQSARMTGEVSALFLHRLLLTYPDVPILLLWDRATWHKGEEVRAVLSAHPRLEALWFPPDCLELNLQEHVWKEREKPSLTIIAMPIWIPWHADSSSIWRPPVFPALSWQGYVVLRVDDGVSVSLSRNGIPFGLFS